MSTNLDKIRASLSNRRDVQQGLAAAAKIAKQKLDGLELWRGTEYQEEAIRTDASEILIQGGTRSGKSMVAAVMVASYLRNKPIHFRDGTTWNMREPTWVNRPVTVWLCGNLLSHIGATIHRLLFRSAFDMVRDKDTGLWRAWQPGRIPGDDLIPPNERSPAPPLIPKSEIVTEVWENKAANEFRSMTMKDGSMAYAWGSGGEVKKGDPVNLIFIDETLQQSTHYPEYLSRLSDRKGRIIWATYPYMGTPALLDLRRRCDLQQDEFSQGTRKKRNARAYVFNGMESPFVDDEEKAKRAEGWSDAEYRARALGEFISDTISCYPSFDRKYHVVDYGLGSPLNDKVTEAMRKVNWSVPADWCVDLVLDPGTARPALLWCAIPPIEFWDEGEPYYIVYREMAIQRLDATEMARRAKAAEPGRNYMRFIGDSKAGLQVSMGQSWSVFDQYSREFVKVGLQCQVTGTMFLRGETNWVTRSMKLRKWMQPRACGRPQLRIVIHQCPSLVRQLEDTVKSVTKEDVMDKVASGQIHDQMDCIEYWAGFDPRFEYPKKLSTGPVDPGQAMFDNDKKYLDGIFKQSKKADAKGPIVLGIP